MADALEDHEGTVSIGGRTITNLRFADDIDGLAGEEEDLVSWYFEPSQPQRITLQLKTMFNLFPIYSARKPSNHKLSINHKINPDTIYIKQNIHKHRTQIFRRMSPFGITPVKQAHKAGTRWYLGPLRLFINTRFFV